MRRRNQFLLVTMFGAVAVLLLWWTMLMSARDAPPVHLRYMPTVIERKNLWANRPSFQPRDTTPSKAMCASSSDLPPAMMARDVTWSEEWPEREVKATQTGEVAASVHYLWCGAQKELTFQHYLGLLSALRVLKPLKFYFYHVHDPPATGDTLYNDWFEEFRQAVPIMDMVPLETTSACGSRELLETILHVLATEGGVYLGERVVLTRPPPPLLRQNSWSASVGSRADPTRAIAYVKAGSLTDAAALLEKMESHPGGCLTVDEFNAGQEGEEEACVALDKSHKYPRDIWASDTAFGELGRWLFYGRRAAFHVQRDPSNPVPRISHFVRIHADSGMYSELHFSHYLSILSSLHVGGFERVYLHVDKEPSGQWWERLRTENVTTVKLHTPHTVYGQPVLSKRHLSDVARFNILYRYGGAYQDMDCVWTRRVPDEVLEYPMTIAPAIGRVGNWPDGLAAGMMLAQPRSPFLRQAVKNYRRFVGSSSLFNAIMMSYRAKELYPDAIRVDPHFKVFCLPWGCTPLWVDATPWLFAKDSGRSFNWSTETLALHPVIPKPPKAFESPAALKASQDMLGDVGRHILRQSGQLSILEDIPDGEQ